MFNLFTGFLSEIGTKLRDWAVGQAGGSCYSRAALSSNDSKTRYKILLDHIVLRDLHVKHAFVVQFHKKEILSLYNNMISSTCIVPTVFSCLKLYAAVLCQERRRVTSNRERFSFGRRVPPSIAFKFRHNHSLKLHPPLFSSRRAEAFIPTSSR